MKCKSLQEALRAIGDVHTTVSDAAQAATNAAASVDSFSSRIDEAHARIDTLENTPAVPLEHTHGEYATTDSVQTGLSELDAKANAAQEAVQALSEDVASHTSALSSHTAVLNALTTKYSGTGAPSSSLGVNGDVYYQYV